MSLIIALLLAGSGLALQFQAADVLYDGEKATENPKRLKYQIVNLFNISRPGDPEIVEGFLSPLPVQKVFKPWQQYKARMKDDYAIEERPGAGGPPVHVNVSFSVIRIHSISESSMSFGLDVYFREDWRDERLRLGNITEDSENLDITTEGREALWRPDTSFNNAIRSDEEANGKNRFYMRLYPDGRLWYSRRISIVADCAMSLVYYPFDLQGCKLIIGSYAYRTRDLIYNWESGAIAEAIEMPDQIQLPEFNVLGVTKKSYVGQWPSGNYSLLEACFILKRSAGFCLVQLIIPAAAVVLCSWVALWLEEETTFNDIIAVVLAIIFLSYSQNSIMPRVSYIKLMDAYFGFCFAFTFFFLVKLVILKTVRRNWERKHEGANFQETLYQAHWAKREAETCADVTICATKAFHVLTQLLLPIIFIGFVFIVMFLLPYIDRGNPCS